MRSSVGVLLSLATIFSPGGGVAVFASGESKDSNPSHALTGSGARSLPTMLAQAQNSGDAPIPADALSKVLEQAKETEGAIFVEDDRVLVKPPILRALITLRQDLSPYALDANGQQSITLEEALRQAIESNLDIKISNTDAQTRKWNYYGALSGFLPDLVNSLSYQGITGKYASPFGLLASVDTGYLSIPSGLNWTIFKGGSIIYGAMQNKHLYKAAKYNFASTTNDILTETAERYYNVVLADILLQIRIKAVQTSQSLVLRNEIEFENGAATKLDVLQARTQLARDRQALVSQQIARRKAAVALSAILNQDASTDLAASDRLAAKTYLVDDKLNMSELIQIAIDNRPELKKYEQQRLAAKDAIKVAFGSLLPSVLATGGLATTGTRVVSLKSAAGSSSASTGSVAVGGFSTAAAVPVSTSSSSAKKFTLAEIYQIGVSVQWTLGGLGLKQVAEVQAAKWQARKAQFEFARQLTLVCKEVRDAYLSVLDAENMIREATNNVNSAREQLEVATVRLTEAVDTDLAVVNAQRDYTQALVDKANAIVGFNVAEVKLLRSLGRMSIASATTKTPLTK